MGRAICVSSPCVLRVRSLSSERSSWPGKYLTSPREHTICPNLCSPLCRYQCNSARITEITETRTFLPFTTCCDLLRWQNTHLSRHPGNDGLSGLRGNTISCDSH